MAVLGGPFWHPLSTLLLVDPPCFATPGLLRMLLTRGGLELRYAGDRMWPAVTHGSVFAARPLPDGPLEAGTAVVAAPGGIPELLRVERIRGEALRLVADADPGPPIEIARHELLAITALAVRPYSAQAAVGRRRWLDAREAWTGAPDVEGEPGSTVREKYEAQAPFYAANPNAGLDPELLRRMRERLPPAARVLVLGSGAGFECFALATQGFRVTGLDFAPAMIEHSREQARRRALDIAFRLADLRDPELELGRYDGMLFTYDVYSFIPEQAVREQVLRRLARALEPAGAIFLSARMVRSGYARFVLTLQRARRRGTEWGDSHTRWVDSQGGLRRSFVHLFTWSALAAELRVADLRLESWDGGHGLVLPVKPL